jgi:hypothetical protein
MSDSLANIYANGEDRDRFVDVLQRVRPHVSSTPIVTGSFAVEWQIAGRGGKARSRDLNDIDIVLENGDADISPTIGGGFLINHYHPKREAGNLLLQLVDVPRRTQIDIFSPRSSSIASRAANVRLGETDLLVASAEDLSARLLAIIAIALDRGHVDPKYVDSFERIVAVADAEITAQLWQEYKWGGFEDSFAATTAAVLNALDHSPDLLRKTEYSRDLSVLCSWCVQSDILPLADKRVIRDTLGYV